MLVVTIKLALIKAEPVSDFLAKTPMLNNVVAGVILAIDKMVQNVESPNKISVAPFPPRV